MLETGICHNTATSRFNVCRRCPGANITLCRIGFHSNGMLRTHRPGRSPVGGHVWRIPSGEGQTDDVLDAKKEVPSERQRSQDPVEGVEREPTDLFVPIAVAVAFIGYTITAILALQPY